MLKYFITYGLANMRHMGVNQFWPQHMFLNTKIISTILRKFKTFLFGCYNYDEITICMCFPKTRKCSGSMKGLLIIHEVIHQGRYVTGRPNVTDHFSQNHQLISRAQPQIHYRLAGLHLML